MSNSVLIRFLLKHDPRVRMLMMLIAYWAKKCNLISVNKFSRHSLNLLIIFYLQNLAYPILPPLYKIVFGIPGKSWPFHVHEDESYLVNNNCFSLHKLFIGFFAYYFDFNFSNCIISTYMGYKIPITDLEREEVLDKMFYYKLHLLYGGEKLNNKVSYICIQDPMVLNINTSRSVRPNTLTQFNLSCQSMLAMKVTIKMEDWLYEVVNGEVAKPAVIAKPSQEKYSFRVLYKTDYPGWFEEFKKDLIDVLLMLGCKINTSIIDVENKETKVTDIIQFVFDITVDLISTDCKKLIANLISQRIPLKHFMSQIRYLCKERENGDFIFTIGCTFKAGQVNTVSLSFFQTGCNHLNFYKIAFPLSKLVTFILQLLPEVNTRQEIREFLISNELVRKSQLNIDNKSFSQEESERTYPNQEKRQCLKSVRQLIDVGKAIN